ncbi:hypothetical protein BDU57DRAFT_509225 [Ampelomyces quisqualis]|uniref:BTB domain-containing protein n=1 Tax=Ampelomyces quisqualis TaxID=50730 RepID=A0A6A5QZA4_AMPQU|nr:hypothetical protein BDU57DRAFT_509225 [Ampelomyces quisqualis]
MPCTRASPLFVISLPILIQPRHSNALSALPQRSLPSPSFPARARHSTQPPHPRPSPPKMSSPPPNAYFQTALLNPLATTQFPLPPYTPPTPRKQPYQPSNTLALTIGPPHLQRSWTLPRPLLAKHSTHLAALAANPFRKNATLAHIDPRAFANFVDYMHSSIYTLNTRVAGFRSITAGLQAVELGQKLGAKAYVSAAVRRLHMSFEALARLAGKGKRMSLIRAEDVAFVCSREVGQGCMMLFFDGVVSHWRQVEVVKMRDWHEWRVLCDEYGEFEKSVGKTLGVGDAQRGELLRSVEEYLDAEKEAAMARDRKKWQEEKREKQKSAVRGMLLGRLRGGSHRRRWSERASEAAEEGLRRNEEQTGPSEVVGENDWMVVDSEDMEEV